MIVRKILLAALLLLPGLAQAAITYIGAGTAANSTDGGAITPSVHASTTTGDLIVCLVGQKNGTDYTILTSTGYTQLYGRNGASGRSAIVYLGKIATGSDSVSVDSSDNTAGRTVIGQCATFRGTLNTVTGIVDASAGTDNTTQANLNTPALDVTVANSVVLIGGLRENQFAAEDMAVLTGMDAEIGQPERTASAMVGMVWDYDIQTTATDFSASSWTITVNTTEAVSIAINLKEAAATPTFSVAPAIGTRTTSTIPVTATTACTDCTFHGVALADGGSATCAEIDGETATGAYKYFHQAMTADAQGTGTFSTYTDGTVRDGKFCLESTANGYSAVSSIADMYKKAAFSVTPSVTAQDDNDYTITKTLDGAGSCTAVACLKDSAAPTVTQILAGNCTGDAAAIATVTDASCEAGTATLGGSLTRPIHDIYVAGTYGSQPSDATTLADEMLDAPTGYQYDLLASVGSTSPCAELNPSITPDIAAADVTKWSSTVSPSGDTLTAGTDCEISYPDPVGNWRSATLSVYDTSAGDWMSGGPTTVYFNYPDPTCSVSGCELIVDQVVNGGAFTAIDVCAMFTDPAGGALTCTSSDTGTGTGADKRPAGTTVTSGVFDDTGAGATSTGNTEGTFSVTATNVAGGTASINVNWFVYDQVNIPDCVGLSLTACGLLLDALNLDPVVTLVYDAGRQTGYVVSQGQAAGTEVDPFTEMDLTVSLGAGPSGRRRRTPGLGVGVGRFVPEIDFDSEWWRGSYGQ